jgi:hypothetical protein
MSTATATESTPALAPLLTRADLAATFHCSQETIKIWERSGRIPKGIRLGQKTLWNRAVIERFLESNGTAEPEG